MHIVCGTSMSASRGIKLLLGLTWIRSQILTIHSNASYFMIPKWFSNFPLIRRCRRHETSSKVMDICHISPRGTWKDDVSLCHLSTKAANMSWLMVMYPVDINLQAQSNEHNLETMHLHSLPSSKYPWHDLQILSFHAHVKINILILLDRVSYYGEGASELVLDRVSSWIHKYFL